MGRNRYPYFRKSIFTCILTGISAKQRVFYIDNVDMYLTFSIINHKITHILPWNVAIPHRIICVRERLNVNERQFEYCMFSFAFFFGQTIATMFIFLENGNFIESNLVCVDLMWTNTDIIRTLPTYSETRWIELCIPFG